MDDGWARLVVFLLGDPHLLEGRERSQDGTTDPDRVLPLRRRDDLDLHARGRERGQLLLHTVRDTREHRGATRQHDVAVQVATDIEVTLEDRVVGRLMDTGQPQDRGTRAGRAPQGHESWMGS